MREVLNAIDNMAMMNDNFLLRSSDSFPKTYAPRGRTANPKPNDVQYAVNDPPNSLFIFVVRYSNHIIYAHDRRDYEPGKREA